MLGTLRKKAVGLFSLSLLALSSLASAEGGWFEPEIFVGDVGREYSIQTGALTFADTSIFVYCGGAAPFVPTLPAGFTLSLRELEISDLEAPIDLEALVRGRVVNSIVLPEIGCDTLDVEVQAHAPLSPGNYFWALCLEPIFLDEEPVLTAPLHRCGPFPDLLHVTARPRPDVIVSPPAFFSGTAAVGLDHSVATPGATVIMSISTTNIGLAAAQPAQIDFFLDGRRMSIGDLPVTANTPTLAPGALADLRATARAPMADGRYRVSACSRLTGTSEEGAQPENVSENNCSGPTTLVVQAFQPGRAIVEKFTTNLTMADDELGFGYRIFNPGSTDSSATTMHLYRSPQPSLEGATLLESVEVSALPADARSTGEGTTKPPEGGPAFYNACIESRCGPVWARVEAP